METASIYEPQAALQSIQAATQRVQEKRNAGSLRLLVTCSYPVCLASKMLIRLDKQVRRQLRRELMNPTMLRWSAGLLIAISSISLRAEIVNSTKDLKQGTRIFSYLVSQDQMRELYNVGVGWDRRLGSQLDCKSQYHVKTISLIVVAPINLSENSPHPSQGSWIHRFELERCGETKIYNAIFTSKDGERPQVRPLVPGTSTASLQLISDSMRSAVATASRIIAKEKRTNDCKELLLADMAVTEKPHDVVQDGKKFTGVWLERWSFLACGQPAEVFMEFIPDGEGGATYVAKDK
jgi:hypothetical protein